MNQAALITGAGSGIGRAVAVSLDGIGLRVALVGRDRAKLEQTRAGLSEPARDTALVVPCDVADRAAVTAMAERVLAALGAIDVLVCNAGTNVRHRSLETLDPADWDRMIATNLTGAYNLVHAVLPGDAGPRQGPGGPDLLDLGEAGERARRRRLLGLEVRPGGAGHLPWAARKDPAASVRRVIYPGEVNTPILDARPVPVGQERRDAILQPSDVAAAVRFLVELHPRANIPELIIKPTVDDLVLIVASGVHLAGLDLAGRELVELDVLEVAVELALVLELPRLADRLDPAVVQDDDLIARPDRREPVRQDDQGAALRQPARPCRRSGAWCRRRARRPAPR